MAKQPSLRFDHREIAVIFSLFVFVSLLMFTVGILVGKGLAQAKYEAMLLGNADKIRNSITSSEPESTSVTTPVEKETLKEAPPEHHLGKTEEPPPTAEEEAPKAEKVAKAEEPPQAAEEAKPEPKKKKLELVPKRPKWQDGASLTEPQKNSAESKLMKNPKIRKLLEDAPRDKASLGKSFAKGKYTVQVGSYPTQKDADDRVQALKKLGYPHAFVSTKSLGENQETWYRVFLGYFPDPDSAESSGQALQQRGEVKNYIVRKADNAS